VFEIVDGGSYFAVALLVEFRRIGPSALATPVRSQSDCHILLVVNLKRHGRRREDVLLEFLRGQTAPRPRYREITIDTISYSPEVVPDRSRFHVQPELAEVHAKKRTDGAGHILAGPVAVSSAELGLAADLRVMQRVNGSKGIHCMIAKAIVGEHLLKRETAL
jgi:hypothetical protein